MGRIGKKEKTMRFTRIKHQAVEYTAYQMNRRAALMKSAKIKDAALNIPYHLLSLKEARDIETFKTWPFYWRFYYRFLKRPTLTIGRPFYNTGRDYYYVGKDHIGDFAATPMSVNTGARKYFDRSNQLVQREQLGAMNFIFFTLFYRLNHPQRAMTQEARSAPLEMGISDKLKATFDIGLFGRIWVMDYWLTDVDVPDCDPLGKAYKDDESSLEMAIRRIRGLDRFPLLEQVEEREVRNPQGAGLISIELSQ